MANSPDVFFAGWGKIPPSLRWFLGTTALGLVVLFAGFAYLIAVSQPEAGPGRFAGRVQATGLLQARPYPVLHVIQSNRFKPGQSIILSGGGKNGVLKRAAKLDGQIVDVSGVRLSRGDLHGMQLAGGNRGLRASKTAKTPPDIAAQSLGKWRLYGEICDGKCLAGAMRPGTGLAHKACANLCLIGGVPPVFVSAQPVMGQGFFLMADKNGGPVTDQILKMTAALVEIEGQIEKRGELMIFKIDPQTIKVAP